MWNIKLIYHVIGLLFKNKLIMNFQYSNLRVHSYISFAHIVRIFVDVTCQTKVTDLHHITLRQEDVSGRQVSMDTLPPSDNIQNQWSIL